MVISRALRYGSLGALALGGVLLFLLASASSNTRLFERHAAVGLGRRPEDRARDRDALRRRDTAGEQAGDEQHRRNRAPQPPGQSGREDQRTGPGKRHGLSASRAVRSVR